MNNENVIEMLAQSKLYHEYEKAFSDATGLPVALRGPDAWKLPHHGAKREPLLRGLPPSTTTACRSGSHRTGDRDLPRGDV